MKVTQSIIALVFALMLTAVLINKCYGVTLTNDIASLQELLAITDGPKYIPDRSGFKALIIPCSMAGIEFVAYRHIDKDMYGFGAISQHRGILLIHWNVDKWYILYPDHTMDFYDSDQLLVDWTKWVKLVKDLGDMDNIHPLLAPTGAIST